MNNQQCLHPNYHLEKSMTFKLLVDAAPVLRRICVAVPLAMGAALAGAQTVGIATMQPGTISHTTASAIAKVLKERAGINALVQPTAGEAVAISMVARGEAEFGLANTPEFAAAAASGQFPQLRLVGAVHPLRVAFFVRKDSPMKTVADLRGKRVTTGYSAMRVIDTVTRAILASGGVGERDIEPIPVSNVLRSAEAFEAGTADMFYFALGSPKVREMDVAVGGIRALEIPVSPGLDGARAVLPHGYLSEVAPSTGLVGVAQPLKVYTFDNLLFTHASVSDDAVYKALETLLANTPDLVAVQPALREFSPVRLHLANNLQYHPGALKYFRAKGIAATAP